MEEGKRGIERELVMERVRIQHRKLCEMKQVRLCGGSFLEYWLGRVTWVRFPRVWFLFIFGMI